MNQRILKIAGLFPYLIALFLNAFVDLGHKITIQNTIFKVYDGPQQIILTALINSLILLPFILLFTPAGFVSDKFPKNKVMRATGWGAIALTLAITICYYQGWFWPAFAMTFLLAIQSAFYSPAKQGYIKPLFGKDRLAIGNGIAQALAIIAILSSTFFFSFFFDAWYRDNLTTPEAIIQTLAPLGWVLVANSILELIMLYRLPQLETSNNEQPFVLKDHVSGKLALNSILPLFKREVIFLSMVGLAVFWSVGQVMLAAFPAFAKESLGVTSVTEIQAVLAASGVGIALGSMIAGRLSRNYIETGLIPVGAAGIALGLLALPFLNSTTLHAINYLFIGTMGGLFIVPLNALIQFHAGDDEMGQILSSKNWAQNIAMFSFLILTAVSSYVGASSKGLLIFTAFIALIGGLYTVWKLPQSLLRFMIGFIATRVYKVNVQNLKNLPSRGGVLLLGNHISWIDWMIIQIASPRPIRFVMHQRYFNMWHSKWLFKAFGCIPIAAGTSSQQSLEKVAEKLNDGDVVCLFPEGTISRTGHLNEFKSGFERACQLANDDVVIVPFYVRGLWGSQFSFASDRLKENTATSMTRDLIVAFGKPLSKTATTATVKQKVFDLSMSAWKGYTQELPSLTNAWIKSVKRSTRKTALIDTQGTMLSPAKLLTASICFSRFIKRDGLEKNIGILLPTSAGAIIANMAGLLAGKTLVNLNYTASVDTLLSALEQSGIKRVYTSKKFLNKLQGRGIQLEPLAQHVEFIYMEELKTEITKLRMFATLAAVKILPAPVLSFIFNRSQRANDTAAILFSSGSESAPKGIMLSHQNIMANSKQISQVLNTQKDDVMMASLPLFHAFGLTVNQFMSLVEDIPVVCHADPTDALGTAKAIATHRATILCGTSTFLRLYCRNSKVHPLMLESLRIIVAGAEKLNAEVRQAFKLKFNKDIFEGYGATETTPVAAVNIPDSLDMQRHRLQVGTKLGSVGMPLPGTSFKIVDPDDFTELAPDEEGMILIGGSQVMQGYLNNSQKTDEAIIDLDDDRWYITGDKGKMDKDGFVTIVDRYSRFAKLGGEMISLGQVEQVISEYLQDADNEVFAINLPDDKKGEKIILLHTKDLDTKALKKAMSDKGCPGLMVPSQYFLVNELPKLGSGKPDFRGAKKVAEELINAS